MATALLGAVGGKDRPGPDGRTRHGFHEVEMLTYRSLLFSALIGIVAFGGRPDAEGPIATLHGVGHLPGGSLSSLVRDATRGADGAIYAVGGSGCANNQTVPCGSPDTAMLWRFDGTIATPEALPDLVLNTAGNSNLTAFDITSDAAYIASQARSAPNGPTQNQVAAVHVTRADPASSSTNLNLALIAPGMAAAFAISDTGTVLYGNQTIPNQPAAAVRVDTASGTSVIIPKVCTAVSLPGCAQVHNANFIVARGTSADGSVAVGVSSVNQNPVTRRAFRYEHESGSTAIPLLPGGAYNNAVALSPDGDRVLVTGNANGILGNASGTLTDEVYVYTVSTNSIERLGSPNSFWGAGGRLCLSNQCGPLVPLAGGMTADGSVVAMNFAGQSLPGESTAYIHNEHGWFHFKSVLAASGIDFPAEGWGTGTAFVIFGISHDGTLVFGQGVHNGTIEGFVAEFPPDFLASFNAQPVPPADKSIIGAWVDDLSDPTFLLVFTADGVYYHVESTNLATGFERGFYTFDGAGLTFTTLYDTNGSLGASGANGLIVPSTVVGDLMVAAGEENLHRINVGPGSIVGGWLGGNPTAAHNAFVLVFTATRFFLVNDIDGSSESQIGTYTWDPVSHELIATVGGEVNAGNFVTLSPDAHGLHVEDDSRENFDLTRVIDPATIPVIANAPLSAAGVAGQSFSYDLDATNTVNFSATGLPDGLSINSSTGVIGGTPTVGGQFTVTILATSAIGVSDIGTLTLTIAIPTAIGEHVVVMPVVPDGLGAVTMTFDEVTGSGTTTVTVLDPADAPPLPGGFDVAGIIYEVETTAQFTGPITLCFSYAGFDFGTASPRLIHFEDNAWVDITTSVDPATQTICGVTSSLSPIAILASPIVRTGFYAPVSPVVAFLNTIKGGSTVPLKFNVSVNGVEQTTTPGLETTTQLISCDSNAPEDDVEPAAVSGGTSLRYDASAGHFIQNWKVPNTPGRCYMVRITTEQDGLALTARFKVK